MYGNRLRGATMTAIGRQRKTGGGGGGGGSVGSLCGSGDYTRRGGTGGGSVGCSSNRDRAPRPALLSQTEQLTPAWQCGSAGPPLPRSAQNTSETAEIRPEYRQNCQDPHRPPAKLQRSTQNTSDIVEIRPAHQRNCRDPPNQRNCQTGRP